MDLNDLSKNVSNLKNSLEDLEGYHKINIASVLTDDFVQHYTKFNNMIELFNDAGITEEDINNYNNNPEKLDKFAREYANFENFQALIVQAKLDQTLKNSGFPQY
ncbi:hypothetical protein AKUH3B204M_04740 [Apilactobacillus kunkeei]|uniref:Uncharacterized protein n=1 Tax=Apilactobacillus kunkeei TaxID=148814 RepID=A0AAC8WAY6_9LACO|nr:hypothetical protein [Apilactobacillus kunkeei]ALJ30748.1 hypothetical protein APS55_00180 [Apilactobacillus kunkeei]KFJ14820.1 hypothetical protein JI66_05360 [Apilactobacillus kunkeei]KPN83177.1 hypothetical protein RZ77_08410 [Apilactobacillus kunkeei]UZX33648.1 hypothetical protein LDX55_02365 [Apilactobacillus kunkeei]CAI2580496.1 hypothetical protein AKUH3B204M_04740 [Apilactobacillus kunkeei]